MSEQVDCVRRGAGSKKKVLRFAFVLPEEVSDWVKQIERVIGQVASAERNKYVELSMLRIPTSDPVRAAEHLMCLCGYDGMALMVPDAPATRFAIAALIAKGNLILCIFSDVPCSSRHLFIGADSRAEGRTAAKLICNSMQQSGGKKILLLAARERMLVEEERRIGFAQLLEESFPEIELLEKVNISQGCFNDEVKTYDVMGDKKSNNNLLGIYCASEIHLPELQASKVDANKEGITVVAHGETDRSIKLLESGRVSYVLSQDILYCISNAVQALQNLRKNMRGSLAIVRPQIEILTAENMH